MDIRHAQPGAPRKVALIAFAWVIALSMVAASAVYTTRKLTRDDCVTVTTQLGEGRSRSVQTCS